jgi:hypothetical protein
MATSFFQSSGGDQMRLLSSARRSASPFMLILMYLDRLSTLSKIGKWIRFDRNLQTKPLLLSIWGLQVPTYDFHGLLVPFNPKWLPVRTCKYLLCT